MNVKDLEGNLPPWAIMPFPSLNGVGEVPAGQPFKIIYVKGFYKASSIESTCNIICSFLIFVGHKQLINLTSANAIDSRQTLRPN